MTEIVVLDSNNTRAVTETLKGMGISDTRYFAANDGKQAASHIASDTKIVTADFNHKGRLQFLYIARQLGVGGLAVVTMAHVARITIADLEKEGIKVFQKDQIGTLGSQAEEFRKFVTENLGS